MDADLEAIRDLLRKPKIPAKELIASIEKVRFDIASVELVRNELANRFRSLDSEPDDRTDAELKKWRIERGYRFEELLAGLFALEGLRPWPSYRGKGEQIDALCCFRERYVLIEAKWTESELPASALYEFWGKLMGKLDGTLGIFISMGGYAEDAPLALSMGKAMSLILVDGDDMRAVFTQSDTKLIEVLEVKFRMAVQRGVLYYTWTQHKDSQK